MAEPTRTSPSDESFTRLVVRYLDGQISSEEFSQLNAELTADHSKRELFVEICLQGRLLAESLGSRLAATPSALEECPCDGTGASTSPPVSPLLGFLADSFQQGTELLRNPTRFSILMAAMTIGSLLTLLAFWAVPLYRSIERQWRMTVEPVYVARLTGQRDCRWMKGHVGPAPAAHLAVGRTLELASGLIEITFDHGARVVVEGPATLGVTSADGMSMDLGQLRARVPARAVGFQVTTPTVKITDLGTEFGLRVDRGGQTEVHVFDGQIQAELVADGQKASKPLKLTANQAARFYPGWNEAGRIAFNGQTFSRLVQLGPPPAPGRYTEAGPAGNPMAYWRFDGDAKRPGVVIEKIRAETGNNNGRAKGRATCSGDVFGGSVPQTGKPNTMCLDLERDSGDYVEVPHDPSISFADSSFTIEAWVKLETLPNGNVDSRQYIVHKKGRSGGLDNSNVEYGLHFTAGNQLVLQFSDGIGSHMISGGLSINDTTNWHYVSAAMDAENGLVRFTLDDRVVTKTGVTFKPKANTEPLIIGGHFNSVGAFDSTFDGKIDELRISRGVVPLDRLLRGGRTSDEHH